MKVLKMIFLFVTFWLVKNTPVAYASSRQPSKASAGSDSALPQILDWLAFGSGCQRAKEKGDAKVSLSHSFENSLLARLHIEKLRLNLGGKKQGLSECAVRISVQPPQGQRISHVAARTTLVASKNETAHLRARLLLLIGQSMVDSHEWDLPDKQFARGLEQLVLLSAGKKSEHPMPVLNCGAAQIIGLDYTLEGLHKGPVAPAAKSNDDEVWLQTLTKKEKDSAQVEVFFEKCN
ncbi:MAG: hypothetical protein RLZZ488_1193 [Pseudomonadota bacterium]|jgi:hypothetical protein